MVVILLDLVEEILNALFIGIGVRGTTQRTLVEVAVVVEDAQDL